MFLSSLVFFLMFGVLFFKSKFLFFLLFLMFLMSSFFFGMIDSFFLLYIFGLMSEDFFDSVFFFFFCFKNLILGVIGKLSDVEYSLMGNFVMLKIFLFFWM